MAGRTKTHRDVGAATSRSVGNRRGGDAPSSPHGEHGMLELQRTVGNKATAALVVQRWNPFKRNKAKVPELDMSKLVVSGPKNGRVMGEPKRERPPIMSMFEFEQDPRRRRIFVKWAQAQTRVEQIKTTTKAQFDNSKLSEEILGIDYVLSPFQSLRPPSFDEAKAMVARLRSCPDPEIKRVIAEAEAKYRPFGIITRLEDAVQSEAVYRQRHGGIQMLAGISGVVHYMGNDLYTAFYEAPEYLEAIGLPPVPAPPSREGRPQLSSGSGGSHGGPPPVPSREGRRVLPPSAPSRQGRPLPLPPVPSRVGRPQLSGGTVGQTPVLGPIRPKVKLPLEERTDPRATERKVLAALSSGQSVPPELLQQLAGKMAKRQTESRGREVTANTEAEYAEIASKLSPDDRALLKQAAGDYTQTSSQINKLARGQQLESEAKTIEHNIKNLDKMFEMLDAHGATDKTRVSYRLATYRAGQDIPFGNKINVGDVITDKAYVSTSENRQFLQDGSVERTKGTRFVKFTIIGSGGANISGAGPYTNEKGLQAKKMLGLSGFHAVGQAEILYRRNTLFKVDGITVKGLDVHVLLSVVQPGELRDVKPKNSFDGSPMG